MCCFFKISLGENDERIITAQLKSTFFHVFSTLTSNFNTTNTASSKFYSPNSVVWNNGFYLIMIRIDIRELRLIKSSKELKSYRFTYASVKASWIARAHWGVTVACFMIIGFPIIIAASADLKGIQNGKLNGTIT